MNRHAWILRHSFPSVVDTQPGRWPWTFCDLSATVGLPVGYAPLINDDLNWGPQHRDFDTQSLLRSCYFQGTVRDDTSALEGALEKLREGDELVLWGDQRLPGCLGLLWAFDWLLSHGAARDRLSLVFDSRERPVIHATVEDFHRLFAARLPLEEVAGPLVELRRFIASDSDQVEPELSAFPGALGEWLQTTRLITGHLPDERGLDIIDDRLLEYLTDDWQVNGYPVGKAFLALPRIDPDTDWLCRRLLELSDYQPWIGADFHFSTPLCELQPQPGRLFGNAQVRITPEGKSVRSGKCRALPAHGRSRWVGGRRLDKTRDLRYPGSHRQACHAGRPEAGEPLRADEQGTYRQLAARPLPVGLALRFAPDEDFAAMLRKVEAALTHMAALEGKESPPLTRERVETIRDSCEVVVVEAASVPLGEIDPVDPWPGWRRLRSEGA